MILALLTNFRNLPDCQLLPLNLLIAVTDSILFTLLETIEIARYLSTYEVVSNILHRYL